MKKLILTFILILTIAACAFSFSACSSATVQGQLEDVWRPYESYVYDVTAPNGTTGTYTVTIQLRPAGESVDELGDTPLLNVKKGYIITGELEIGTTEFNTGCYFALIDGSDYLIPVASYRKQTVDGTVTLETRGDYKDLGYDYYGTVGGENVSGNIALTSPFYDNNEFHQSLRGADIGTNFSFSFQVPIVSAETAAIQLSASCNGVESISAPYFGEEAKECYKVTIGRSTKVAGTTQTLYYAKDDITVNGWALNDVLVKIVEPSVDGNVTYVLKEVKLEK